MKKFWYYVNETIDWIMNLICAVILFGGGAWIISTFI